MKKRKKETNSNSDYLNLDDFEDDFEEEEKKDNNEKKNNFSKKIKNRNRFFYFNNFIQVQLWLTLKKVILSYLN